MAVLCRPAISLRVPGWLVCWDTSRASQQSQQAHQWIVAGGSSQGYATAATSRNYYDVLGLTPKASSAEVKSAYYRLSKKYHPDVNASDAATMAFSELSEAYEVLGNRRSRRLYDRGHFRHPTAGSDMGPTDAEYHNFIKKHGSHFRPRGEAPRGKTNIYDFDEFYRQHYEQAMERQRQSTQNNSRFEQQMKDDKQASVIGMTLGTIVLAALWASMKLFRR